MSAEVVVVIGSKGGCGATTLCVDAAKRLSKRSDVALVDGDLVARRAIAVLLDKVRAEPGRYVAQERVALSTVPVWEGGPLHPRHLVVGLLRDDIHLERLDVGHSCPVGVL